MGAVGGVVNSLPNDAANFVYDMIPLSGLFGAAFRACHIADFYLTALEQNNLVVNHWEEFIAGAAVNVAFGDRAWIRRIAQIVVIAKTVLVDCNQATQRLTTSYRHLCDVWNGEFPLPAGYLRQKGKMDFESKMVRPHFISDISSLPEFVFRPVVQIESVGKAGFQFVEEGFLLSRQLRRLYEAIVFDRYTEMHSINSSFINAEALLDQLTSDPERLIQSVRETHSIDRLFQLLHIPCTKEDVCALIQRASPVIRSAGRGVRTFVTTGRRAGLELMHVATGSAPRPLIPLSARKMQPLFIVKEWNDNQATFNPARKARPWKLTDRYYVPYKSRRERNSDANERAS